MKRTKFYIHSVWVEDIINGLTTIPDSVKLEVYQAIMQYGFYRNLDGLNLSDMAIGLFVGIRPQLDGGWEAYDRQCECNRKNGNKGGAPKGNRNAMKKEEEGNNPKQPIRLISVDSRNYSESDSDSDLELDSDKIKNKIKIQKSEKPTNVGKESAFPFDGFWDLYGKKVDRKKCESKWARLTEEQRRLAMNHVPRYIASSSGRELKYRKNPLTYLNGECWNDDIIDDLTGQQAEGAPFIDDKHKFDNETGW